MLIIMNFYEKNNCNKKDRYTIGLFSVRCVLRNNYGIGPFHPVPGYCVAHRKLIEILQAAK